MSLIFFQFEAWDYWLSWDFKLNVQFFWLHQSRQMCSPSPEELCAPALLAWLDIYIYIYGTNKKGVSTTNARCWNSLQCIPTIISSSWSWTPRRQPPDVGFLISSMAIIPRILKVLCQAGNAEAVQKKHFMIILLFSLMCNITLPRYWYLVSVVIINFLCFSCCQSCFAMNWDWRNTWAVPKTAVGFRDLLLAFFLLCRDHFWVVGEKTIENS